MRRAAIALALAGGALLVQGLWIPAKAALAQVLLERAFASARAGEPQRPWPWADTRPVARLTVPARGVRLLVLAGASGATLAFGPGHLESSAPPGAVGNTVIAGHRDTHFAFLRGLAPGDRLELSTPTGVRRSYAVAWAGVVHERDPQPLRPTDGATLTLVTCWPFDAVQPGGPLRFVVVARAASDGRNPPS